MGHKGSMESRYTTNKGILPDVLTAEMREAFLRSEEHLEQANADPLLEQRAEAQSILETATPEQLDLVLKVLMAPARQAKPDGCDR